MEDPVRGPVALRGELRVGTGDRLVVLVHGLGGGTDSEYVQQAVVEIEAQGLSSLVLAVRGACRRGTDFHHAGLSADLHATIADAALERFRRIDVLGFSMGGHVSLCFATETEDPRVAGVVAVCPPLALWATAAHIDRLPFDVYRHHVLRGLKDLYRGVATRAEVPTPVRRIERVRRMREWDALTVVPRIGFDSVDHYYATQSAGPRLSELRIPSLVVAAEHDPMIPIGTIRPYLDAPRVTARVTRRGGHVFFPGDLHLGFEGRAGLVPQALGWLDAVSRGR